MAHPSTPLSRLTMDEYNAMTLDRKLMLQVLDGSTRAVKQLLDEGAPADGLLDPNDGSLSAWLSPLALAAKLGRVGIIKLLVEEGADLEVSQPKNIRDDDSRGTIMLGRGSVALHAAAFGGHVEAIRCLLELGADPNAIDDYGKTALMVACGRTSSKHRLATVRQLLKGGADAAVADKNGALALHEAAGEGHTDVFASLLSAAPSTISLGNGKGFSVLAYATLEGHGAAVAFLLSAGSSDKAAWLEKGLSPLVMAIQQGYETIARMFLDKRGIEAAGGLSVIPKAMTNALQFKRVGFFKMLLNVDGEQKQEHWANATLQDITILHCATLYRSFAALQMLFAAGADLTPKTLEGNTARDLIPCVIPGHEEEDEDKEDAIQAALERLFDRAPACRARSWAWPAGALTAVGVQRDLVVWRRRVTGAPLGASIFRPTRGRWFATRFAR